ncbi:hypothetical protein ACLX1H_009040 [Fusarium chlamydosporum]
MYEEEDYDLSRFQRLLGCYIQTASAEVDSRVDAYLMNRVTIPQLVSATEANWRHNRINRTFPRFVPLADRQAQCCSQRWSTSGFHMPLSQKDRVLSSKGQSYDPKFDRVDYRQQSPRWVQPLAIRNIAFRGQKRGNRVSSHVDAVRPAFAAELHSKAKIILDRIISVDTISPAL